MLPINKSINFNIVSQKKIKIPLSFHLRTLYIIEHKMKPYFGNNQQPKENVSHFFQFEVFFLMNINSKESYVFIPPSNIMQSFKVRYVEELLL